MNDQELKTVGRVAVALLSAAAILGSAYMYTHPSQGTTVVTPVVTGTYTTKPGVNTVSREITIPVGQTAIVPKDWACPGDTSVVNNGTLQPLYDTGQTSGTTGLILVTDQDTDVEADYGTINCVPVTSPGVLTALKNEQLGNGCDQNLGCSEVDIRYYSA